MRKKVKFSAKTTDDALEKALAELGLERDEVSVEIIERGKSGFLGFGAVDASIYVTYDVPDEKTEEAPPAETAAPPAETAAPPVIPSASVEEKKTEPSELKQSEAQEQNPEQEKDPTAASASAEAYIEKVKEYLTGLFRHMGVAATMEFHLEQNGCLNVALSGKAIGMAIGRRGETLDAIQHLTNYSVNRGNGKRYRIRIDAENYRARREESIIKLAHKQADKVVKYRRSMALDPMNAYERHLVHAALQNRPDVTTGSTGVEPNRRVVISYVPTSESKSSGSYQEWC